MRRFEKSHAVRDPELRSSWRQEQSRCACCWRPYYQNGAWIECHHIVKPGRSDELCNFLGLCAGFVEGPRCHELAEGMRIRRDDGELWPTLSLANCLWLKRESDPENFDPARLEQLLHKFLPEPERPSELFFQCRHDPLTRC